MRIRVDLAYDGTPFAGFARQPEQTTVQGDLEVALHRIFGQAVGTTCAGRTDRGVHATAQVIHADVADPLVRWPLEVVRRRLDALVGEAITIWKVRRVGDTFNARFSATHRVYRYRLVDGVAACDPRVRFDRWRLDERLDVRAMRQAAAAVIGEHDFASFCRASGRHTVRRVERITINRPVPDRVDIVVRGNAFCHQQVRSIVGCLVEIGRARREVSWLAQVLVARDRSTAARVAPARGLTLEEVGYGRGWPAAPPPEVRRALRLS